MHSKTCKGSLQNLTDSVPSPKPTAPKFVLERPTARPVPDELGAIRGFLIGSAIGLAIWGALFGVWVLS